MASDARPRVALTSGVPEWILGLGAWLSLIALVGVALWAAPQLPPVIPVHFGIDGTPDGWGPRSTFWALPIVGVALYAALTVLARFPRSYNYLWPITEANAERQYQLARRLVLALRLVVMLNLLHILYGTALVAQGRSTHLGVWGLAGGLIAIPVLLAAYTVAASRAR